MITQLDRPVLLALVDASGRRAFAPLVALDRQGAVIASGDQRWQLPTAQLAALWRGDLATWWRMPPGLATARAGAAMLPAPGASGPAVLALQQALAQAAGQPAPTGEGDAVYDAALRQRVAAFQLAVGLKPDGLTGPTTCMLLNRALAVDEPRLGRE